MRVLPGLKAQEVTGQASNSFLLMLRIGRQTIAGESSHVEHIVTTACEHCLDLDYGSRLLDTLSGVGVIFNAKVTDQIMIEFV